MKHALAAACTFLGLAAAAHADCTLLVDAATRRVLEEDGRCDQRITPASTFKIAIALMGYDAGFLKDEHAPALPYRPGYPDWLDSWKQTTDPTRWIAESVVWYSQQVTGALGMPEFARYAEAFGYGNHDVSGGLTTAWLNSSLRISPREQAAFLGRLVRGELPVSARAVEMTARITALPALPGGWALHGKTGTGAPRLADGRADWDHGYGWFVGWATRGPRTVVFVRQIQDTPDAPATRAGLRARDAFLRELPALLPAS